MGEIDPGVILEEPTPLDRVVLNEAGVVAVATSGLSALAVILLGLAASGIYAVMSHMVAQRTREIGIRSALGARPGRIAATIGRRAAVQLTAGALLGMPLAGWLYYLVRDDPGTAGSAVLTAGAVPAVLVMLLVGLLACTAPLSRALRITPMEAMRVE